MTRFPCIDIRSLCTFDGRIPMADIIVGESKAPCWRLCGLHRPAEPGGKARNYGLFQELLGVVK